MNCLTYNKPLLFMMFPRYDRVTPDFSNSWSASIYDARYTSETNGSLFAKSSKEIVDKYKSLKGKIAPKAKLYFSSNSKFPRFKLADTEYKRCIKLEKADTVVMNEVTTTALDEFEAVLYEAAEVIYCVIKNPHKYWNNKWQDEFNRIGIDAYMKKYKLGDSSATKCYDGKVTVIPQKHAQSIYDLMEDLYSNIVTDDDLDKMINITFDKITHDDLKSITEMLDSTDKSVQALGLKMLCGYNVNDTPVTVKTLLGFRDYLSRLPEWKGVGVQQILKSVGWSGFMSFPHGTKYLVEDTKSISEYDKSLIGTVLTTKLRAHIDAYVEQLRSYQWISAFGISFDVNVEQNNSN